MKARKNAYALGRLLFMQCGEIILARAYDVSFLASDRNRFLLLVMPVHLCNCQYQCTSVGLLSNSYRYQHYDLL